MNREEEEEEEDIARDSSKRTGFGLERYKQESNDPEKESASAEDEFLDLGDNNYPSEVLSKVQEGYDDDADDESNDEVGDSTVET